MYPARNRQKDEKRRRVIEGEEGDEPGKEQPQKEQQEQIKDVKQNAAIMVTKQCGVTETTRECLC